MYGTQNNTLLRFIKCKICQEKVSTEKKLPFKNYNIFQSVNGFFEKYPKFVFTTNCTIYKKHF